MIRLLFPLVCLALAPLALGQTLQSYSVQELPNFGGQNTTPYAINRMGWIVGESALSNGYNHAFLWDGNLMIDLGSLGKHSTARAINSLGIVTGSAEEPSNHTSYRHVILWDSKGLHDLGDPFGQDDFCAGEGINDLGVLVGHDNGVAFWYDGAFHSIPTLGGRFSAAYAINNAASIVGNASLAGDLITHAFVYNGAIKDLGTLGGSNSYAHSISDTGWVVGVSETFTNEDHGFRWRDGVIEDLAPLPGDETSSANGVNQLGEAVGLSAHGAVIVPVIWVAGEPHDLNGLADKTLGARALHVAFGINDSGEIVASAVVGNDVRAVLLTPHYPVAPTTYTLYRGRYVSGGLSDLFDSDDAYLRVYPGLVMNGFEAPVQVVVTGTARSLSHYSDLRLKLEAHVSSPNLRQTIELYDYQSGQWVNLDTTTGTSSDSVRTAIAPDPSRFVQFLTNEVKARLSWKPAGLVNAWPWTASLDQVQWTVTP